MLFLELLKKSELRIDQQKEFTSPFPLGNLFQRGGFWMLNFMQQQADKEMNLADKFYFYGMLKYFACITISILAIVIFYPLSWVEIFLVIILFYAVEVHFLFLFPLIIEQAKNPMKSSVQMLYRIGLGKAVITVIPIAVYMIIGLLSRENPFRKWHIGCGAIVVWYEQETKYRL